MQDRLRILEIISGLGAGTGGPAQAVLGLSRALVRQGHHVTLLTTDLADAARGWGPPPRGGAALASLLRDLRSEGIEARAYPIVWPARYAYSPGLGRTVRRIAPDVDVAHIHSLYLYPAWIAASACIRVGVPYVVRPHGILTEYQVGRRRHLKSLYNGLLGHTTLKGAALLHYTSAQEQQESASAGYAYPSRVVRLGVDVEVLSNLPARGNFRRQYPAIGSRPMILFMSRLVPKKGLDLLVFAFVKVREAVPEARLVIAGPDPEGYGAYVRRLVTANGLEDVVVFTGMLVGESKLEALRDADIWTLPSYAENFGIAVVEAMAAGLPVVISDRVDLHPQVGAAGAGLVVQCSVEAVASAIRLLLGDPMLRMDLGSRGANLVGKSYSWDAVASETVDMYRAAIGN